MSLARVQFFSISLTASAPAKVRALSTVRPCRRSPARVAVRHPVVARIGRRARRQRRHRRRRRAAARSGNRRQIMGARKFGPPGWHEDPDGRAGGVRSRRSTPRSSSRPITRAVDRYGGGTTFHFLDASPADALEAAREAAGGQDVRIGGGATTIREFVAARLIDHLHIAVVPILLGRANASGTDSRVSRRTRDRGHLLASGVTHVTFTRAGLWGPL